jgi:cytochrome c553
LTAPVPGARFSDRSFRSSLRFRKEETVKRIVRLVSAVAVVALASTAGAAGQKAPDQATIERGRYLVDMGGCNDCHSPKVMTEQGPMPDETRLLSGHPAGDALPPMDTKALQPGYWYLMSPDLTAFVGPWGQSFAANLTPDNQTGIGLWTEDVFVNALRTGKHMGAGRPILPPMPWQYFNKVKDEDLKAIFAYLKSLPPVSNAVPAPVAPPDVK